MLPLEENREVVSIEYETGELVPESIDLKNTTVDIRCTDNYGRQFIVEMQMNWTESFKSQVLFNASKTYARLLESGQKYKALNIVYSINFVNDIIYHSPKMQDKYYHHYGIADLQDVENRMYGMEFVFIELPKFKPHSRSARKLHELWLRFLTEVNGNTDEVSAELLSDENIREAVQYSETGAYSKSQLLAYQKMKMIVMDECSRMSDSEEKGIAKGIVEERERIAVNALKSGMSPEDVGKLTGMSPEEIDRLNDGL
jgi:predicted transposase/invertase (TIGR01784 family)